MRVLPQLQPCVPPLLLPPRRSAFQRPCACGARRSTHASYSWQPRCLFGCLSGLALVFQEPLDLQRSHAA